jgi:hypothetical protein
MLPGIVFRFLSAAKQVEYARENGVTLGTRMKDGRKAYLYMIKNLCIEVLFKEDNDQLEPEKVTTFGSVKKFNNYLEKEFRTTF